MKTLACIAATAVLLSSPAFAQEKAAPSAFSLLTGMLNKADDPATQLNLLRGINAALKGKRDVPAPEGWPILYTKLAASPNQEVRQQAQTLAATFGGGAALADLRKTLADSTAPVEARKAAVESIVSAKDAAAVPALLELLKEPGAVRPAALRGLASFDDARIPEALLSAYPGLTSDEKRDALNALLTRLPWAKALVTAIDKQTVSRADLSAPAARQLQSFKDPEIEQWLAKNWGAVRASSADKQKEIARYKTFLTPANFESADPHRGRAIFSQTCQVCHTLFGTGGKIGPELTGAYSDVDYLLQNILDPNAIIGKDYQQTIVRTKDGQMVSGIIVAQDNSSVTLKTLGGAIPLQRGDIAELTVSEVSMMPEGLLSAMSDDEIRDLFAYLGQHGQIPVLATTSNANDFFNGTDLTRWNASGKAWKVENGEIIGRSGAAHPEFLVSDMVAGDFRLTAQIRVMGTNATAELAVRGLERDGRFEGASVGFGGNAPVTVWKYRGVAKPEAVATQAVLLQGTWVPCEIVAQGETVKVLLDGKPACTVSDVSGTRRSVLAFHLLGDGAELRIKDPKLELLAK